MRPGGTAVRPRVNTRLCGCVLVAVIAAPRWYGCASQGEYSAVWLRARSGDSCAQAVRLRVPGRILGCAVSRSCSGLFVVSIGYTLTIRRKQHEKRFTRVIKRIMKRIIITIYPIDTNAHIAYT